MLGLDGLGRAVVRQAGDEVVPPDVELVVPGEAVAADAAVDDDGLERAAAAHRDRLVHRRLERDLLAAAVLAVGGDDQPRAGVRDALVDALRGEAAEHHRVDRADTRAGLHRHHRLDGHRQVDQHAVALLDAELLEAVGELADALVELLVADLGDRAVVGLEDDRRAVGDRQDVAVEAVVRRVEGAVREPLVERRVRLVERLRERLVPQQEVAREAAPVGAVVLVRFGDQPEVVVALQVRLRLELRGRLEDPGFVEDRFDRGHAVAPPGNDASRGRSPRAGVPSRWVGQSNRRHSRSATRSRDGPGPRRPSLI